MERHPILSGRRVRLSLLATIAALCLLFATSLSTLADTVRISDQANVLNASQIKSEGSKLTYPLDVYTTNIYNGTATVFVQRTISAHLTSNRLIVIAIDTVHRFLAIVGGSSVSLSKTQYTTAGTAFKNNINGSDYTSATIAAIKSLESSLGIGGTSGPISTTAVLIVAGVIVGIIVLLIIINLIRRALGLGGSTSSEQTPSPQPQPQVTYGDGRDNFGSGAAGDF